VDQSFAQTNVTVRDLERAIWVLQDLAELMLPEDADVEYQTNHDIERVACSLTANEIILLFVQALDMSAQRAQDIFERLTSKPFQDLGATFRNGLWHRPLVANSDHSQVHLALGALVWGSPIRRVERWLHESSSGDLSKLPTGLRYEAHLRDRLQQALMQNEILGQVASSVISIGHGEDEEEIDAIVRIGSSILVMEIKCLLGPADPIDRADYVVKLEDATSQAIRKATWVRENVDRIVNRVGTGRDGIERIIPMVVVNQSNGSSCQFEE
jgi:hypothetical protein